MQRVYIFRLKSKPSSVEMKKKYIYAKEISQSSCSVNVVLYGSETWTIKARDARRITAAEMKYMRRIELQNKFTHCKGIRNNTGSKQTTGIQEELDKTCKQNASRQTIQDNETVFPNWQKESWQTSEETSTYVRPERVNKWPDSMTDI